MNTEPALRMPYSPPPPPKTPPRSNSNKSMKRRRDEAGEGGFRDGVFRSPNSIDEMSSKSGGTSWRHRIPWLRNNDLQDPQFEYTESGLETPSIGLTRSLSLKENTVTRAVSYLSKQSSHTQDSITDFDEAEWTPQDSAYGAACPICGFLPKNMRRAIEVTIIALTLLLIIFIIVTTSMRINQERDNGNHSRNSTKDDHAGVNLDDDYYIGFNEYDDYVTADDNHYDDADDYFADENNGDDDQPVEKIDDDQYYQAENDDAQRVRYLQNGMSWFQLVLHSNERRLRRQDSIK